MFFEYAHNFRPWVLCFTLLVCFFLNLFWMVPAEAGNWRVAPIRISFDATSRSEVVTINNDGDQPLNLEVSAVRWMQDASGQNIYQPATDLIYFPKQLVIEPQKERVIRTGVKVPAGNQEKTYRLFIKEVPDRSQRGPNTVALAIQFGVPVFVKPPNEEISGAIVDPQVAGGVLSARVENRGNSHFRVKNISIIGVSAAGEQQFSKELSGWYLLNNRSRTFEVALPEETCSQINTLDIQIQSDKIELEERINVDPAMCTAP